MNKSMNEAIVIASEQVEEINENFAMEEVNSEDKPDIPSRSQPADDYDDSDDYSDNDDYGDEGRVYRVTVHSKCINDQTLRSDIFLPKCPTNLRVNTL
jgi:hypothetical protein